MRAYTHRGWAHPQQVSTIFLTRKNAQFFLVLLTGFEPSSFGNDRADRLAGKDSCVSILSWTCWNQGDINEQIDWRQRMRLTSRLHSVLLGTSDWRANTPVYIYCPGHAEIKSDWRAKLLRIYSRGHAGTKGKWPSRQTGGQRLLGLYCRGHAGIKNI